MKALISFFTLLFSITYTLNAEEREPKRLQISDLATLEEGEEAIVRFKVRNTFWMSGSVPKGQARSFGIQPVIGSTDVRISVLVVGELADAMERFGFAPPNPGDRLAGATIEARGKVFVYPASGKALEKGASYQLRIGDLKGFRIVSQRQAQDGADQPAAAPGAKSKGKEKAEPESEEVRPR